MPRRKHGNLYVNTDFMDSMDKTLTRMIVERAMNIILSLENFGYLPI